MREHQRVHNHFTILGEEERRRVPWRANWVDDLLLAGDPTFWREKPRGSKKINLSFENHSFTLLVILLSPWLVIPKSFTFL